VRIALVVLGLQFVITWSSIRVSRLRRFVTDEPALLRASFSAPRAGRGFFNTYHTHYPMMRY